MSNLKVRENVLFYKRDTYLGSEQGGVKLNPDVSLIDCAVGDSQWGISPKAREAGNAFLVENVSAYPHDLFYEELLKPAVLARFHASGVCRNQVFFGHGSFNLAERLIHKMIEPGVMIGVGPQFNEIPSEFVAAGGSYQPLPVYPPMFDFPMRAVLTRLARGDCSVMYLDNPNNPLGRLLELENLELIVKTAEEFGTIVVVDEAYGDFVPDANSAIHLVGQFSNLAVLRSCSKGLGLAAERVGYMFLSEKMAGLYQPLDVPFEPSLYAATLARATMEDGEFQAQLRDGVTKSKRAVTSVLMRAGFQILPTHPAVSIMTIFKHKVNVVAMMADWGIMVEAGSCFGKTHPGWDDSYCRLRLPRDRDLEEFCRRIG